MSIQDLLSNDVISEHDEGVACFGLLLMPYDLDIDNCIYEVKELHLVTREESPYLFLQRVL